MDIPFVDLRAQYEAIKPEIDDAIQDALARADFIMGEDLASFEREFAAYIGVDHCVGLANGTDALVLAQKALGVGPGADVIIPANTFIATALAVTQAGNTPVLIDIDPLRYTMDVSQLEGRLTGNTKAIIPVHLYGRPAEMDAITAFARDHDLVVIEDACQAHGAMYHGKRCGALGHAGVFSFYPAKNLGAYGDGGALVTRDGGLAETVRGMGNYGQREKYIHVFKGGNSRLDTLQAAILRVKLRHLDDWSRARARNAERYREALSGVEELVLPLHDRDVEFSHVFHLYVVQAHDRDGLLSYLKAHGVQCGMHYPEPIHFMEAYRELSYEAGDFVEAEKASREIISLPMYAELTEEAIHSVASAIRQFYAEGGR